MTMRMETNMKMLTPVGAMYNAGCGIVKFPWEWTTSYDAKRFGFV